MRYTTNRKIVSNVVEKKTYTIHMLTLSILMLALPGCGEKKFPQTTESKTTSEERAVNVEKDEEKDLSQETQSHDDSAPDKTTHEHLATHNDDGHHHHVHHHHHHHHHIGISNLDGHTIGPDKTTTPTDSGPNTNDPECLENIDGFQPLTGEPNDVASLLTCTIDETDNSYFDPQNRETGRYDHNFQIFIQHSGLGTCLSSASIQLNPEHPEVVDLPDAGNHYDGKWKKWASRIIGRNVHLKTLDGFDYYNPAVVEWAINHLIPNPNRSIGTKTAAERYQQFSELVHLYADVFVKLLTDYDIAVEASAYKSAVAAGRHGGEYLSATYNPAFIAVWDQYATSLNVSNYQGARDIVGFWLRRAVDGTSKQFWRGLMTILHNYDPAFENDVTQRLGSIPGYTDILLCKFVDNDDNCGVPPVPDDNLSLCDLRPSNTSNP